MILADGAGMVDWTSIINTYGIGGFIAVAVTLGAWTVCRWVGKNVVAPIVASAIKVMERQVAFIDKLEKNFDRVGDNVDKLVERMDHLAEDMREVHKKVVIQAEQVVVSPRKGPNAKTTDSGS